MPQQLDSYPHPQLRYTVRLEYINPSDREVMYSVLFMSAEEFDYDYDRLIEGRKESIYDEVMENDELEVTQWGVTYIENTFFKSSILSDNLLNLLSTGSIFPAIKDRTLASSEEQNELAYLYLCELTSLYTKDKVAKEIIKIGKYPYHIVNQIMLPWLRIRATHVEMQLRSIVNHNYPDQQLCKLLRTKTPENLKLLKSKLARLNDRFAIKTEKSKYLVALLFAKFIDDCPLIDNQCVSFKEAMSIMYEFFDIPESTYKRIRLLPPNKTAREALSYTEQQCHRQISSSWADFKREL